MNWQQALLNREAAMRLFQQLHQDDEPERYRAEGEVRCLLCGYFYREHSYFDEQTLYGHSVDHRLYNGDVVHL